MSRYIKTDILAKIVFDKWQECEELKRIIPAIRKAIMYESTADVRENVHAEWLPYEFGTKRWHICSACGIADEYINEKGLEAVRKYCPFCGAQMDERRRR